MTGDPLDPARRAIADAPVAWDDMRERRVLGRVEALVADRAIRRRRGRLAAFIAAPLAAAAALFLALSLIPGDAATAPADEIALAPTEPAAGTGSEPVIPAQTPQTLELADGSLATLRGDAHVSLDVQTHDLVRLVQTSGVVTYSVTPVAGRRFIVDAAGVEVRVIGTVFTVGMSGDDVEVEVTRGRVEVDTGERVAELSAGDELRVPAPDLVVIEDETPPTQGGRVKGKADAKRPPVPPADELLSRADAARRGGRLADAAAALSQLVRNYRKDPRAYSSYYQLGKVERARGHHSAAASAFAACYKRLPSGTLSESARAEAAVSWMAAGKRDRARRTAGAYLQRHPSGEHAARMRRILDRTGD